MTGHQILLDMYERLTSRRFLLTLVSIGTAYWQHQLGALTPVEFQTAVVAAVTAYLVSEGASDVASQWHSSPDTTVRTTVNTGTEPPSTTKATTTRPERRTRPPVAPADDPYANEDAYEAALATVRAEEAQKRRLRDARRRQGVPMTEPVAAVPVRRPRPRPAVTDEGMG